MELEYFGVRHYIMSLQCLAELETFGGIFPKGVEERTLRRNFSSNLGFTSAFFL